ncbi:MAG: DoxX family membrane protein [Phycisphaerales bacterium]
MRFRDHVALTLPALILRMVLCITFLWAGMGKIMGEFTVTGDSAARLANMGVMLVEDTPQDAPPRDLPEPSDTQDPEATPPADATPPTELIIPDADETSETIQDTIEGVVDDTIDTLTPPTEQPTDTPAPQANAAAEFQWLTTQVTQQKFTASDFPGQYSVQRVYGVALLISRAGDPGYDAESNRLPSTLPAKIASERWPKLLAWTAAVTELLAAVLLFFGVLTRIGAFLLMGVMITAIWLTQIGPAAVGTTDAYIGFIPKFADPWAPESYTKLLWQLACFAMATAIFLLGSGPIGFDRALFRPSERLERNDEGNRKRTTFDRGPNDTP